MKRGRSAYLSAPWRALVVVPLLCIGAVLGLIDPLLAAEDSATTDLASGGELASDGKLVSGGRSFPGIDPRIGAGPGPTLAPAFVMPPPCLGDFDSDDRIGGRRNQFIVTASYCAVLRRLPDPEGMTYWVGLLADGLSPAQLVGELITSPEFEAGRSRSFSQSLSALTLGPGREDELRRRIELRRQQEREAADSAAASEVDAAPEVPEGPEDGPVETRPDVQPEATVPAPPVEAVVGPGLRPRSDVSVAEFEAVASAARLESTDRITEALIHGRIAGDRQPTNVAFVHLSKTRGVRVSPGERRRATVGTWAAEIGAHVAINGNWYAPYDGPAVAGGAVYGGDDHFYTALFGFTATGDAVIEHHRAINATVDSRIVEGVSGHPTLIHRGTRTIDFGGDPTFTSRQPRTAIGLDQSGDVLILVTVDGRSSTARGMTGDETAQLMERLGAYDAVMLDGGGSSTMWIADRGIVNQPSGSLRAVGNQLAAYGN